MGLLYNYNSFSLRRTNKHPSSGPNLPLNLFFTEFMFFITLSRHSQKHNFSTFSSKIYSWTSLQFIFSPLNFFHRPVFRPVPRTLDNSHRVSNSHLTFSTVTYIYFQVFETLWCLKFHRYQTYFLCICIDPWMQHDFRIPINPLKKNLVDC